MKSRVRKGDEVVIITGNDKGKVGKVMKVNGERITVEQVNLRKKHMRKTQEQQKGQIIDIECPIHISNVKIWANDNARKLRVQTNKDNEREYYYSEGKKKVLYRTVRKQK